MFPCIHECNRFYDIGYQDGFEHGRVHGLIEGRSLGKEKGFEMWEEVGFYMGFATIWKAVLESQTEKGLVKANFQSLVLILFPQFCSPFAFSPLVGTDPVVPNGKQIRIYPRYAYSPKKYHTF
jgi:hypothetical protein